MHPAGCTCRLCWLRANDPRYGGVAAQGRPPPANPMPPGAPAGPKYRPACEHLGRALRDAADGKPLVRVCGFG